MGLWSWFRRKEQQKYSTEDLLRDLYGGAQSQTGISINAKTALQCSVAFACARVISHGMSSIPFRLMQAQGDRREPVVNHPMYALLDEAPNEFMTSVDLFDTIGLHLAFCGNAFLIKNGLGSSVYELLPVEPGTVTVENDRGRLTYKVNLDDQKPMVLPAERMWHIRGPSWNGWMGLEGIQLAREAIGLALASESHGATTFTNGALLGGILSTDANLTVDQREGLRRSWTAIHGGADNAGKIAVMSNGMKFSQIGSSNVDAQWLESRKYQVEEVCRVFGVMPIMVGYSDKAATYASAEQMFLAHVVYTLGPWHRRLEKSAAVSLLTPEERKSGHYFKFFTQALLRGAAADRGQFYTTLYNIGAINPNEIRALEDMNPYDGGEQWRVPLNMVDPNAPPEPVVAPQEGPDGQD